MTRLRGDPWHADAGVLEGLTTQVRGTLMGISHLADFAAGEIVMRDGAPTPFMGVVESGRVGLRLHVPERGPRTVVTVEPGELLGWSAVVPPYRATAEAAALDATRMLAFEAAALRALIERDRDLAVELLPMILGCVSLRLVISWQQLLDLFGGDPQPW